MRYKVVIVVLAAVLLTSCFKKVTTDTNLIIKTLIQEKSGGENTLATDTYAYACYTGTNKWMVASYDDAVNRIVTDSLGVERITVPDVESVPFVREGDENHYVSLPLNNSPALVVLVAPSVRMYATIFKYLNVENIPETYMTLLLHPWKTKPYTEGSDKKGGVWNIMPPAPEPEPETPEQGTDSEQDNQNTTNE
ncbi:MAG: hypothetical protein IJX65_00920 [Alistipes sp.]|nr:hypothetical protein [Alistipes sp.]